MPADLTLESIYTSPKFFGIETATSVQRAICRIAEGRPLEELAEHPDVREAVGGDESLAILAPGSFRPREIDLLCAIRSGKSFFAAAHAFWSAMTARIESLKAGEVPRYPILSVNLRSSEATFAILSGTILARPALRALLVGEVGADSLTLRHPSGRPVECTLAAGARAGANVISVWLAGVTFEEYPRQAGEGGGAVVNYDQQLQAAIGRVVEGGQILSVGSPWAPSGPAYERFASTFGRPTEDRVVVKATGPQMNPTWWTPARCESLQRSNPTAYTTDVLAGFADPSTAFIPQSQVRASVRKDGAAEQPATNGWSYLACMDPGTRGNRWTLIVLARQQQPDGTQRFSIALSKEWGGTTEAPLSVWHTLAEIKRLIAPYWGMKRVYTDQFSADAIRDLGARMGLDVAIRTIVSGNQRDDKPKNPHVIHRNDMFEALAGAFATNTLEIPDDRRLVGDLLTIRRVVTRTGITYDLPETADRRHCDGAAALAMSVYLMPGAQDLVAAARAVEHRDALGEIGRMLAGEISNAEREAIASEQRLIDGRRMMDARRAGRASIEAENAAAIAKEAEEAERLRLAAPPIVDNRDLEERVRARLERERRM